MASSNTFRVTPEELSGVAGKLVLLAARLDGVGGQFAAGTDPGALSHGDLVDQLHDFLSGWSWGCEQLRDELMDLSTVLKSAAANYSGLDEGLAAAERGGSDPTSGTAALPTY